jgi:predicted secreted protein
MACDVNVTKGRDLVFFARDDDDTKWQIIGGVKTRGYTFDNPVEDITSSSTTTDYSESEYTGYSQVTLNVSGNADKRTGTYDPGNGITYDIVGSSRLLQLANSGQRCGKFLMLNVETDGCIEGEFNITSYSGTGDTPGLLGFDATLQSRSNIIVNGDV